MSDFEDDDISQLEDRPEERETSSIISEGIKSLGIESITPDTPIYRLRLSYSRETFLAIYRDDSLESGSMVIVPTRYGKDLAQVIGPVRKSPDAADIAWIERPATKEDLDKARNNQGQENARQNGRTGGAGHDGPHGVIFPCSGSRASAWR